MPIKSNKPFQWLTKLEATKKSFMLNRISSIVSRVEITQCGSTFCPHFSTIINMPDLFCTLSLNILLKKNGRMDLNWNPSNTLDRFNNTFYIPFLCSYQTTFYSWGIYAYNNVYLNNTQFNGEESKNLYMSGLEKKTESSVHGLQLGSNQGYVLHYNTKRVQKVSRLKLYLPRHK